jgi:CHAT domain-containing protein
LLSRYNLAYLRYLAGDTAAALEELLRLKQEYIDLKDDWMTCQCWLDESEIFLEIGNIEDSISAALAARKLASKLALNSEIAKSLLYEAVCLMQLGKAADAQKLLDEATTRFASEGDQTSTAVSKLQACLFRAENGDEAALLDAIDARDRLKDVGLPHRLALADIVVGRIQRAAGEFDRAIKSFRSALNSAAQSRSLWMQFHASCELGLSLDRLNDAEAHELFRQADGMLDSLWDRLGSDELKMTFLADRENVYTHLVRSAVMESPSAGFEYAEKARSRVLSERLLGGSAQRTASHLRSRLSADESIVEYFVSGDDLYIFVLRKDELLSVDCHGIVRHVKSEWKNLERHLQSCSVKWEHLSSVRPHLQTTARHHLRNLYDDLVAPVEHALAPVVIFAPHGFLHDIPMQALFDGSRYLAERCDVGYTPSASLYCNPAAKQQFDKPLFIAFSTSPDSSSVEEVQQAASLAGPSDLLVNPSIEVLRHAFRVPREIVHIAGHARVDAINGTISSIETADGPLTNRDLLDMQVRAKTLVITGCQTARRAIQPGDEWLGLMRSFYLSGASTIVSALWDIRDEAARRFAGEFYRQFDGGNALPAVRNAAAEIRHWKGHPYFWSGFGVFVRRI